VPGLGRATNHCTLGIEDPAAVSGDDNTKRAAFVKAFAVLQKRIALPHEPAFRIIASNGRGTAAQVDRQGTSNALAGTAV
jgi:hypothetical protein